jgi:hypothetical protein
MKINSTNYTMSDSGIILHEGSATADTQGERVFALGPNTEAFAIADGTEAVALGCRTYAEARGLGARAISHNDSAHASAWGEGAVAIRTLGTSIAYEYAQAYEVSEL